MMALPLLNEIIRRLQTSIPGSFRAPGLRPWARQGIADAAAVLHVTPDEEEMAAVWSLGFERGATEAVRFAKIVLSDPQVRGREREALDLIGDGYNHLEILAALRTNSLENVGVPDSGNRIIPFPPKKDRT